MSRGGQQNCEGSGIQVFWGVAEGTGVVQSGEEEAQGRPHCSIQLLKGGWSDVGVSLCSQITTVG